MQSQKVYFCFHSNSADVRLLYKAAMAYINSHFLKPLIDDIQYMTVQNGAMPGAFTAKECLLEHRCLVSAPCHWQIIHAQLPIVHPDPVIALDVWVRLRHRLGRPHRCRTMALSPVRQVSSTQPKTDAAFYPPCTERPLWLLLQKVSWQQ